MQTVKQLVPWLIGAIFLFVIYVWNFGLWPVHFDISWDEEVRLHDGRMVVVHIRRIYARQGLRLERWSGVPSSMEFSFDTGTPLGKFNHKFDKGRLVFLDQENGKWYIGYSASRVNESTDIGNRLMDPHVAVLELNGTVSRPASWDEIPSNITDMNIMPPTPNSEGIAKFDGTILDFKTKQNHWNKFPTGVGEYRITRITEKSN